MKKRIWIEGVAYKPFVLLVRTKNADGTPGLCEHVRADDEVKLSEEGQTEFLVAYGKSEVFSARAVAENENDRAC